jgi:SAM-dependent methyltransferase
MDSSSAAVALARERSAGLCCRFEVAEIPPLPPGPFDVVLLLETMLAFADKEKLLVEVAAALAPRGRFAFTVEVGEPLTEAEQESMPDADTVWLVDREGLAAGLDRAGLRVRWMQDVSDAHRARAAALTSAYAGDQAAIASLIGGRATDELLRAHRLWSEWLRTGRVRKFALVATTFGHQRTTHGTSP